MYSAYYNDWKVRPEFSKEFVCIFNGWLGLENLHKLDEVTENEWEKFNTLIKNLYTQGYKLHSACIDRHECLPVTDISLITQTYKEAMEKDPDNFIRLIIPELECILVEDWDYTYVLWHKNNGAVEKLSALIKSVGLYHFHD